MYFAVRKVAERVHAAVSGKTLIVVFRRFPAAWTVRTRTRQYIPIDQPRDAKAGDVHDDSFHVHP